MRKAFFEAVDSKFKYDFGPNTFIIEAILNHPKAMGDGISFEVKLSGTELIEFIKESAPTHLEVIRNIHPGERYTLSGWDW